MGSGNLGVVLVEIGEVASALSFSSDPGNLGSSFSSTDNKGITLLAQLLSRTASAKLWLKTTQGHSRHQWRGVARGALMASAVVDLGYCL